MADQSQPTINYTLPVITVYNWEPIYTFFWSGHKSKERREAGVRISNKTDLVGKLSGLPSTIDDNAINRLPQVECNALLDEFPTVTETSKAIKLLSSDKALGFDAIPADI